MPWGLSQGSRPGSCWAAPRPPGHAVHPTQPQTCSPPSAPSREMPFPCLGPRPCFPGRPGIGSLGVQSVPGREGLSRGHRAGPGGWATWLSLRPCTCPTLRGTLRSSPQLWRDRPWGRCRGRGTGGSQRLAGWRVAWGRPSQGSGRPWDFTLGPAASLQSGTDGGELTGLDTQRTHPGSSQPVPTPSCPQPRGPCLYFPRGAHAWRPSSRSSWSFCLSPAGETQAEPSAKP